MSWTNKLLDLHRRALGKVSKSSLLPAGKSRVVIDWFGEARKKEVERELNQRLHHIMDLLESRLKQAISIPVDYSARPPIRSKVGEYPRLDTGHLRNSISTRVHNYGNQDQVGILSVSAEYAAKLEFQMGRKLLTSIFKESQKDITTILLRPGYLSRSGDGSMFVR